jgi:Ca-activated chloride channel family protein
MISLDLSTSMSRSDVAPTRLERAKQKIRDLLAARVGARTGLIAYAGTAHLVMPLTSDQAVIAPFLAALSPEIMPVQGKNAAAAVTLAAKAFSADAVAGSILIVGDDLGDADPAAIDKAAGRNGVLMLAVAPEGAAAEHDLPGGTVRVSIDDADIHALQRRIETRFETAQARTEGTRWRDEGFWLLLPCLALTALWFRPGTTVQWLILGFVVLATPAHADMRTQLRNFWLTPDQQGQRAFNRGDCAAAKTLFVDPMWRGTAAYCAYDFLAAAEAFQKMDTLDGRFALANAQAQNHQYEKAIALYDGVLAERPDHAAAKINREIVRAALEKQEEKRREQEKGTQAPNLPPDETKVDPNQKGGKQIQVQASDVTTPDAAEAWMRQVQTSPDSFLKLKFAIQSASTPAQGAPAQ